MEVHRHDYVEIFLLQGQGSVLIAILTIIRCLEDHCGGRRTRGVVHAWQANRDDRPLYCLLLKKSLMAPDHRPATLFDYPFIFGGELSSVIHLKSKQHAQVPALFRDINCEFERHEKLAVEMIRLQLRLLMVHLSRYMQPHRPLAPGVCASLNSLQRRSRASYRRPRRS